MEVNLSWNKCQGDVWCRLSTVNLAHEHFSQMYGVYVIWHGGSKPETVFVGYGNIRDELVRRRTDPHIQQFAALGLFVTWAAVAREQSTAVAAAMTRDLRPKIGSDVPADIGHAVTANLPWR